jgi:acetyl esterase/lipase
MQRRSMRLKTSLLLALLLFGCIRGASSQQIVLPLYPGVAPGSEGKTARESIRVTPEGDHVYSSIHQPSIAAYLPDAALATGVGVLVIPGGGHREIWADHEGFRVAEWLSQHGIAAFVLKYRLAREAGSTYTIEGTELGDVRQAMRLIRSRAAEWQVDPKRLGAMGFSAGGELAALVATRSDAQSEGEQNTMAQQSSAPAFQALIYPAIPKDMPLSEKTPPAFLACGANDEARISEALPELYLRMKHAGTPVELHVFAGIGHGFGIRSSNSANVAGWPNAFYAWLESSGFIKK